MVCQPAQNVCREGRVLSVPGNWAQDLTEEFAFQAAIADYHEIQYTSIHYVTSCAIVSHAPCEMKAFETNGL